MSDINGITTLHLLLEIESFRFDPKSCGHANVTLLEAKFLRWFFPAERSNVDVIQYFGLGFAYKLFKQGLEILKTLRGAKL